MGEDEKIIDSYTLFKYRGTDGLAEAKGMIITSKHLFNLEETARNLVKRKIPLDTIYAISISEASNEFIVHISAKGDFRGDYRYSSNRRVEILEHLFNWIMKNSNRTVGLYFHKKS